MSLADGETDVRKLCAEFFGKDGDHGVLRTEMVSVDQIQSKFESTLKLVVFDIRRDIGVAAFPSGSFHASAAGASHDGNLADILAGITVSQTVHPKGITAAREELL